MANSVRMILNAKPIGEAGHAPLVVLHGLLGSSRNWLSAARDLSRHFDVTAMDLRNHGSSDHAPTMTYAEMAADVAETLDHRKLHAPVTLCGHSMGGKVAMRFAVDFPERVRALCVIDIAPKTYPPRHDRDLAAMREMPLADIDSRRDADAWLRERVPEFGHRQFLLTNLVRDDRPGARTFRWAVNLDALIASADELRATPLGPSETSPLPTTFLIGGASDYVNDGDHPTLRHHFPRAAIKVAPEAGHNLHMDARERVVEALLALDSGFQNPTR